MRLYDFADGMYVVDATDRSLVRNRLVAIEGIAIERVLEQVEPLVPRDNTSNLRGLAPHYLLTAEVLDGLGVVDEIGAAELTFEQPDGQRVDIELTPLAASRYISTFADPLFGHYPSILPEASQPLYLSGSARPLWARALAGGRAVYVGYNSVRSPAPAVLRKVEQLVREGRSPCHRGFATERWRRQHDVRLAYDALRLEGSEQTGEAPGSHRAHDVLRRRRLRRRDRSCDAGVFIGVPRGRVETYADTFPVLLPTAG